MIIKQLKNGYHYNSDTLVLYDFISSFLHENFSKNLLDVGCGNGIIGMLLKRDFPKINLTLLDILDVNLELCKLNLSHNKLQANLIKADFAKFKTDERYALIISNPPYYHNGVKQSENKHIGISRYANNLNLNDFLRVANTHLTPNGELIFCYESGEIQEILAKLQNFKLTPTHVKFIHPKADKNAKLVLIRAKKNSRSKCVILPPLFMKDDEKDSEQATKIYKKADTKSEIWEF